MIERYPAAAAAGHNERTMAYRTQAAAAFMAAPRLLRYLMHLMLGCVIAFAGGTCHTMTNHLDRMHRGVPNVLGHLTRFVGDMYRALFDIVTCLRSIGSDIGFSQRT